MTINLENENDTPTRATSVEAQLIVREDGRDRNLSRTTVPLDIIVPTRAEAVAQISVPLSLDAVASQVTTEVPEWFTTAVGAVSGIAQHLSGTAEVRVSVEVHFDGLNSPARGERTVTRHGHGSFGVGL